MFDWIALDLFPLHKLDGASKLFMTIKTDWWITSGTRDNDVAVHGQLRAEVCMNVPALKPFPTWTAHLNCPVQIYFPLPFYHMWHHQFWPSRTTLLCHSTWLVKGEEILSKHAKTRRIQSRRLEKRLKTIINWPKWFSWKSCSTLHLHCLSSI